MAVLSAVALYFLAKHVGKAAALPSPSTDMAGTSHEIGSCVHFTIPVTATSQNHVYNYAPINSNIDATAWVQDFDCRTTIPAAERITQNLTVSGTYEISAQLCIPKQGNKKQFLQIATHGAGFDSRYWNVRVNPSEYSYVDAVLSAGYSIVTYDRLGTGNSLKPDAYKTVQLPLEVEILRGITEGARSGRLLNLALKDAPTNSEISKIAPKSFSKFILVGHSYGSVVLTTLVATYGKLVDAAVITGFLLSTKIGGLKTAGNEFEFARQNDPALYKEFGSGYIVAGTPSGVQTGFFSSKRNETAGVGGFEPELLAYANEIKQPLAVGEMYSILGGNFGPATEFKGPIQLFEAEYDNLVCGGDCNGLLDDAQLKAMYPSASDINTHIQPGSGHGLTMHRGANAGYKLTFDWLSKNGY